LLYGRPKQTCGERRLTARARLYGQKNPVSVFAKAGSCEAGFKRFAGSRDANSKSRFVISLFKIGGGLYIGPRIGGAKAGEIYALLCPSRES